MKVTFNELQARSQIAATQERYRRAMDAGQLDAVVSTFTRDGILDFSGRRFRGATAIRNGFVHARKRPRRAGEAPRSSVVQHVVMQADVTFTSAVEALATTAFTVQTPVGMDHQGRYLDRLVQVDDGRWLIAHRQIVVDWAASGTALGARSRRKVASSGTAARVVASGSLPPAVAGGRTRHVY